MKKVRLSLSVIALASFFGIPASAATPPSTGQNIVLDAKGYYRDISYQIISDSTGEFNLNGNSPPAASYWAPPSPATYGCPGPCGQGNGWAITPAKWIAPDPDQRNATRLDGSWTGAVTYQLTFTVTSITSAFLYLDVNADDSVIVTLNGVQVPFIHGQPSYQTLGQLSLCLFGPTGPCDARPASGLNTMQFLVSNASGGPTGLNVFFSGTLGDPDVTGKNSAPGAYHLESVPDPVDGASGQFYDTFVDLKLGGPLALAFSRYYSSALSVAGLVSGLGVNWMSNFDLSVSVSGASAKALLFGGKVVQFTSSGGVWQVQSPLDTVYQLVAANTVNLPTYQLMDPASRRIYTFDAFSGALKRIQDRNGNAITVTQGLFGPTAISDGLGRTLALTYTNGQLTQVQDQGGRTFTYANNGLLTSATDPFHNITKYTYVASGPYTGLMAARQLPLGNTPTTQAYDVSGRVISQTDGNNHVTQMAYDGNGGTTITDPLGSITRQGNDQNGDVTGLTDSSGGAANVTYDAAGRRTGVTDKSGNHSTFTWHGPTGYAASGTDALGDTTAYSYTAQVQGLFTFYNLTGISHADGTTTTLTYDASGNMLTKTAPDGSVTKYTYDTTGHVLTIAAPAGVNTAFTWNADSTMASMTDALGNQTVYAYDALKRLSKETDPNGNITSFAWDAGGVHMSAISGPAVHESETVNYDANGQELNWVNGLGAVYAFAYTNTGRVASMTDPLTNKTVYTYDAADRLATITDPTGVVVTYAYDALNHVKSISDPSGPRVSFSCTADGYIAGMSDGSGNKTSYSHDALGRLAGLTTPAGNGYVTAYDKRSRVIGRIDPLDGIETLTRDANGNVTQVAMPGGITTSIGRNPLGNPTSVTSANGNKWTVSYDAANRPSQTADPLGNATSLTYTGNQLTQVTLPLGAVTFTDNADGSVTKTQYSDGTAINAAYDAAGLLISADNLSITRDAKGQPANINGIGIALDGAGRPATLTYAPGKTIAYTYNSSGRLTAIADWVGGKTSLGYDASGRLATLTYPNGAATTYSYDVNGRLIQIAFGSLGSIALTRDAAGKITAANRSVPLAPAVANLTSQQFSYDAAGQLTSATSDKMGRVTSQGSRTYSWNLASQLTSFNDGTNAATFTYDGLGGINTMTTGGTVRSFVFNYLFRFPALAIVRQGGSDLRYYVHLPDGRLLYSIEANNTRHYYHFDEMGNTVLLSGDTGAATDSYAITPYGDIADHSGTADNPFTWQGQYGAFQEGTALYNLRNRHYDASAARFVSRDSVLSTDPRSSEPYAYGNGNPLLFVDPFGTDSLLGDAVNFLGSVINTLSGFVHTGIQDISAVGSTVYRDLGSGATALVDAFDPGLDASGQAAVQFQPQVTPADLPPPVLVGPPALTTAAYVPVQPSSGEVLCRKLKACDANGVLISQDGGGVVSNDGGSILGIAIGRVVSNDGGSLINEKGGGIITDGASSLIAQDGSSLIGQDGSGLIGQDGSGLIGQDGSGLIGQDGSGLIGQDGSGLIGQDGSGVISHDGGSIRRPAKPRRGTGPAKPAK